MIKKLVACLSVTLLLYACSNAEEHSAERLANIRNEYKKYGLLDGVKGNTLPHSLVDSNGQPIPFETAVFVYNEFVDEPHKDIVNEQDYRALWKQPQTYSIYPTYDLHVYIRRHDQSDDQKQEIYPFYGVAPVLSQNGDRLPMSFITLTTETGQALTTMYPKETYDIIIEKRPNFALENHKIVTVYEEDIYVGSDSISGLNPIPNGYHYALVQTTTPVGEFTYQRPVAITTRSYEAFKQNETQMLEIVETSGRSFYSQFYTPRNRR